MKTNLIRGWIPAIMFAAFIICTTIQAYAQIQAGTNARYTLTLASGSGTGEYLQNTAVTNASYFGTSLFVNSKERFQIIEDSNGGYQNTLLSMFPGNWSNSNHSVTLRLGDQYHYIKSTYSQGMTIYDGNNIVLSGSNVGIGTTVAPKGLLHVNGDYYGNGHIWLHAHEGDGVSGTAYVQARDKSNSTNINLQFRTQNNGSFLDAMFISNTGKVGIGTKTPEQALHVNGNIKASVLYADNLQMTDTANTWFGRDAGRQGLYNSNFGTRAGINIDRRSGFNNSNFGYEAGHGITLGGDNINVGYRAGGNLDGTGNVVLGSHSAENITTANYSVFLGYNAGSDFSHVTFEGGYDPLAHNRSVFVVNNQAQLHNPLLFGVFVDNTDKDNPDHHTVNGSMAQLAINTHHLVDSCALTVAGAVHIGPRDIDPSTFPADSLYSDYLLWAERGVVSENFAIVKVEDWGDYVFNEDYELTPLAEVAKYIEANKHLPNVPSEAELKERGYTVHDMNKKFMEKIEELTLYSIEQEKKIADLQQKASQYDALKNEVETLRELVQTLIKK